MLAEKEAVFTKIPKKRKGNSRILHLGNWKFLCFEEKTSANREVTGKTVAERPAASTGYPYW